MKNTCERRSGRDRRQEELAFPPEKERRHRIEQRKLEVEEITMDEQAWEAYFLNPGKPDGAAHHDEHASHVLDKAGRKKAGF